MRRLMIGLAALTLTLSACEMRAEISVNPDGSGTFGFLFGMEEMLFGSLPDGVDPLAQARADLADDPVEWKVSEFSERGLKGFRATAEFGSLEEFRQMAERLSADQGADAGAGAFGDTFSIERTTNGWRLDAHADAPALPEGLDRSGGLGGAVGDPGDFQTQLGPSLDQMLRLEFHVTLPGDAQKHNADEVRRSDGRSTFVWRVSPSSSEGMEMRALTVGGTGGGSLPVLPIALAVGALGIVAVLVLRRRGPSGTPPVVLEGLGLGFPVPEASAGAEDEEPRAAAGGE